VLKLYENAKTGTSIRTLRKIKQGCYEERNYMTCEEKIYSNDYMEAIAEFEISDDIVNLFTKDYCYQKISRCFGFVSANRNDVKSYNVAEYGYSYVPKLYTILAEDSDFDTFNLNQTGIFMAQNPPLNLTGRGVVVGFIDTGIDYTNDVFRNADGTTRILALWDQNLPNGTKPEGILYGTEFKQEQINQALKSSDPYSIVPSKDENGHGTSIASVACGSRLNGENDFFGAAPDSQLLVVKLKQAKPYLKDYYLVDQSVECYQETDILAALLYMDSYAISLRRPLVVCMALGTNQGGHSGDSKVAQYMSRICEKKSRAVVSAVGNEGIAAHHYSGSLSEQERTDTVEVNVGSGVTGFMAEFWGQTPYLFGVRVRSPLGEITPVASLRSKQTQQYQFILDKSVITFDALTIEQNTGRLLIEIRIKNPSPGVWQIVVSNISDLVGGEYDIYLPVTEFMSGEVTFIRPDPRSTIVNPSFSAQAITVSSYDSSIKSVSPVSGRGYSLSGAVKPDLAVAGVNIPTILGRRSGSSYAAALASGGVAQLMQWAVIEKNDILIDSSEIKSYLIRGAIRDKDTKYPNPIWGYGLFNVNNVFQYLATLE